MSDSTQHAGRRGATSERRARGDAARGEAGARRRVAGRSHRASDDQAGTGHGTAGARGRGHGASAPHGSAAPHVTAAPHDAAGARRRAPRLARWAKALLCTVAVVAVAVLMLYEPACELWSAWRTNEALASTYDELVAENEELTDDVERLQTLEGIEDEARQDGYVYEGETGVIVEGLDTAEDDEAEAEDDEAEEPWYVQLGDLVFGYEG